MGGSPRKMNKATLQMAATAMSDKNAIAANVAKTLNITNTTLYAYVNGDDSLKQTSRTAIAATKKN